MSDELAQLQNDIHELELTAGEYPHESPIRYAFLGFVSVLQKSFKMTESDKLQLVLDRLKDLQPCTRGDLVEQLPFVRDESRRLVTLMIDGGLIEAFTETTTGGRPAKMLRLP
jgi:hypothetical protein